MKSIITDKWILCPECKAKTRTQVLENTELKNFSNFADLKKYVFKEPGKEDLAKFAG